MRSRPRASLRPSRKAPLSRTPRPRSRSFLRSRNQSHQEQDISCRGASRRQVIAAMEKFMDELQVLNEASGGPPNFRGDLRAPVIVSGDAFAVAGEIQSGAILPGRIEHGAEAAAFAARPEIVRQH